MQYVFGVRFVHLDGCQRLGLDGGLALQYVTLETGSVVPRRSCANQLLDEHPTAVLVNARVLVAVGDAETYPHGKKAR